MASSDLRLEVRPATPESLAPFGQLLEPSGTAVRGLARGAVARIVQRGPGPHRIARLLRYPDADRLVAPIEGTRLVLVLLAPRPDGPHLAALLLPPGQGVLIARGTWHADPIALTFGAVLELFEAGGLADRVEHRSVQSLAGAHAIRLWGLPGAPRPPEPPPSPSEVTWRPPRVPPAPPVLPAGSAGASPERDPPSAAAEVAGPLETGAARGNAEASRAPGASAPEAADPAIGSALEGGVPRPGLAALRAALAAPPSASPASPRTSADGAGHDPAPRADTPAPTQTGLDLLLDLRVEGDLADLIGLGALLVEDLQNGPAGPGLRKALATWVRALGEDGGPDPGLARRLGLGPRQPLPYRALLGRLQRRRQPADALEAAVWLAILKGQIDVLALAADDLTPPLVLRRALAGEAGVRPRRGTPPGPALLPVLADARGPLATLLGPLPRARIQRATERALVVVVLPAGADPAPALAAVAEEIRAHVRGQVRWRRS